MLQFLIDNRITDAADETQDLPQFVSAYNRAIGSAYKFNAPQIRLKLFRREIGQ